MTARSSLVAAVFAVFILSCDTDRNIGPVFETYFTKYYGADGNQYGVDLAVGNDGSLVMVGRSESQTNSVPRSFIVKTDGNGAVLWERQLGGDDESPADVEFDSRNDIIVVSNVATTSIRLTRISQGGVGLDSILITGADAVKLTGTAVTELSDGNFIVTGHASANLVDDYQLPPPDDQDDLLIYWVDPEFDALKVKLKVEQGGEHYGKIVKMFESSVAGPKRYYRFGDSDRPFAPNGEFRQTFEAAPLNDFFLPGDVILTGPTGEIQLAREAIEMPIIGQPGYLMVGNTGNEVFKQIFIAQYYDKQKFEVRFSRIIPSQHSAEGISVAYGEQETLFVLADEKQDNNKHDIYLVKLNGEGKWLGEMRFGSVEGDDQAAAVRVLPDQRVAVFGTIELETQKKMMLTLVSPQGTFSE